VAPSFSRSEAVSLKMLNSVAPRVAIGLHVALTAPFRPASKGFAPMRDGAFLPLAATFRYAALRRFRRDALVSEIRSQLQAFVEMFGHAPDFIDGHQHVHLLPQVGEALLQVVKDMAPDAWVRQCGRAIPLTARFADRKGLLLDIFSYRFRRRAAALGVRTNPAFAGAYEFSDEADFAALFPRFLEDLPDGSVVMCHPGFVDAELRRLDPLTTLREKEYAFLASDTFPALLAARGLVLA
jgi:chitin disaccharide deacetylase